MPCSSSDARFAFEYYSLNRSLIDPSTLSDNEDSIILNNGWSSFTNELTFRYLFKDKFLPFIPLLSNGKFKFGNRNSMVVPISYENPLFAIFEADDAFKIKSEFVRSLLFLEFDKFMNLNYMKFEGFRKTVKYSASLDDSFIKRFISSDNSNTDMYISISNNKQCVNKSIVAVPDGQTFDAPSDQTSNFNKTGDKSGPTLFKSFKRSFSSVSSSRYNDLVKKRSSDLKYKFNKCEIQDIHRYYLSNFNKSIPVSKLNPKTHPNNKLESKTVMDNIVISL